MLTLRKNIVQKVRQLVGDLSPEQAQQLELLMTEDRSTQVLMDRTLGVASVIDGTNLPMLLEDMKRAAIQEAQAVADAKVASTKAEAKANTRKLTGEIRSAETKAIELAAKFEESQAKQFRIVEKAVSRTNKKLRKRRIGGSLIVLAIALVLEFVAFFYSESTGFWGGVIFATLALGMILGHFRHAIEGKIVTPLLKAHDERIFNLEVADLGLSREDVDAIVYYDEGKYVVK